MKKTDFPSAGSATVPENPLGFFQRIFQKIRLAVHAILSPARLCRRTGWESALSPLTAQTEAELDGADWHTRDVLVGSLRSPAQLADNLQRRYYYVPARTLPDNGFPIRYIALYQSRNLFGGEAGIRYYGAVSYQRPVHRKDIHFPLSRNNPDELYYAFRVESWRALPSPIEIRDEGVSAPKFTSLFLLEHCTQSFELFHIRSRAEFCLMAALRRAAAQKRAAYRIDDGHILAVVKKSFVLMNAQGKALGSVPLSSFARSPSAAFRQLRNLLREVVQE